MYDGCNEQGPLDTPCYAIAGMRGRRIDLGCAGYRLRAVEEAGRLAGQSRLLGRGEKKSGRSVDR